MAKSDMQEVLEVVNFIKDRMLTRDEGATKEDLLGMATKEDVAEIRTDLTEVKSLLTSIEYELRDINRRLDALEEQFGNLKGITKEIDELRGRVKSIEEHLKARGKTAA